MTFEEGWYLMSTRDLEIELARRRNPSSELPPSNAERLSVQDALAYRNAGNLPDEKDRSLRLVLIIGRSDELTYLDSRRSLYEPDYHEAPAWRREGSRPVNVVPLRDKDVGPESPGAWWDDPELGALEREWRDHGTVGGLPVPGEYRAFVYKTVLALRSAGREVTVDTVADSIARWVPADEAVRIRTALEAAGGA